MLTCANIATPIASQMLLWVIIGAPIIGVVEGSLVAWLFKQKFRRCIFAMILANMASTLAGIVVFGLRSDGGVFFDLCPPDIYNHERWLRIAYTCAFVGSVLIEWPILRVSMNQGPSLFRRSVKAVLVAHVASYLLFFGMPWTMGWTRFSTDVEFDPALRFVPESMDYTVYFIDHESGDVVRMRLDGAERAVVLQSNLTERWARLFVYGALNQEPWDLRAHRFVNQDDTGELVLESFASPASAFKSEYGRVVLHSRWMDLHAADLRLPGERAWEFVRGGDLGVAVSMDPDEWNMDPRFEITRGVGSWKGRNATLLPHGFIVFELAGQICVMNAYSRTLGVLSRGKGPVVVPGSGSEYRIERH